VTAAAIVRSFVLNDGTEVTVPESGVVLFVGPNNAGKSQALRDIQSIITSQPTQPGIVISEVEMEFRGTREELEARFRADRSIRRTGAGEIVDMGPMHGQQQLFHLLNWWPTGNPRAVAGYFIVLANTESRLAASYPVEALNLYDQNPNTPLHALYSNPEMEERLNAIGRQAFRSGLILDTWAGGSQWSIRVGEIERPNSPRPDTAYLDALNELPLLHQQGDGVRSMIGLLLVLMTGHQSISLVDEPEAFLHPPQARFLGKLLSENSSQAERTTFLSTHSADVVHGILEGDAAATVVRLRREGPKNVAAVLDNEAVRRLWSDPLLRYSNLLDGLFTDAVVICESDADCKFFASIRDTLPAPSADERRPDLLFTSCGGKHRMHVGVTALRAASVPVAVLADFDVLNDWPTLLRIIESAGGDGSAFETDWKKLNGALMSTARTPSVAGMREAVNSAFEGVKLVSAKELAPVREALKIESGWDRVKNSGLGGVPKGDPYQAAERILAGLKELRIHLIPIGEMEDFLPMVSGHGPAWLADVLEDRLHESPSADPAREFFLEVVGSVIP
jgi:AAA domain, putative AbiEii toxin, Type IV TA system